MMKADSEAIESDYHTSIISAYQAAVHLKALFRSIGSSNGRCMTFQEFEAAVAKALQRQYAITSPDTAVYDSSSPSFFATAGNRTRTSSVGVGVGVPPTSSTSAVDAAQALPAAAVALDDNGINNGDTVDICTKTGMPPVQQLSRPREARTTNRILLLLMENLSSGKGFLDFVDFCRFYQDMAQQQE